MSRAALAALLVVLSCGGGEDGGAAPPATASPTTIVPEAAAPDEAAAPAPEPPADEAAAASDRDGFPPEQLDALVAPIALYPDALLTQVLMASTYPTEIVMADRWRQAHPDLDGAALDEALAEQTWDPSVSSLTFFPDVLRRMSEQLEWTTDLGNAFLAQQADVMDACQRMRMKAHEAGTLETTKEQTVVVEQETITIEPADPEVVYVPQYNTTQTYGSYQPPPQYYPAVQTGYSGTQLAMTGLLSFGAGMLTSYALWGDCDWDDHDVYYGGGGGGGGSKYHQGANIGGKGDDTININVGGDRNRPQWKHDPEHRRGVAYPDHRSREQFARNDPRRTRFDEQQVRGRDGDGRPSATRPSAGTPSRPGAGAPARPGAARPGDRPGMPPRPSAKPAPARPTQMPAARPQAAKPAVRQPQTPSAAHRSGGGQSAYGGSRSAGMQRQASQRGAASRGRGGGGSGGGGRGGGGGKRR